MENQFSNYGMERSITHIQRFIRDNDLKYRYIQMKGGVSHIELMELDSIFEHNRDSVERIRRKLIINEKEVAYNKTSPFIL